MLAHYILRGERKILSPSVRSKNNLLNSYSFLFFQMRQNIYSVGLYLVFAGY